MEPNRTQVHKIWGQNPALMDTGGTGGWEVPSWELLRFLVNPRLQEKKPHTGLSYKQLYKESASWEHFVRKVFPWPYCKGRAHYPVTQNQVERTHMEPTEQSLYMESNSEDSGPSFAETDSTWPIDSDAVSTLSLWIRSRIGVWTHHTLHYFFHSLFKS